VAKRRVVTPIQCETLPKEFNGTIILRSYLGFWAILWNSGDFRVLLAVRPSDVVNKGRPSLVDNTQFCLPHPSEAHFV